MTPSLCMRYVDTHTLTLLALPGVPSSDEESISAYLAGRAGPAHEPPS